LVTDPVTAPIRLPVILWRELILQLRKRSAGRRESGAFLLGVSQKNSNQVTRYICYDDLDPNAYQHGAIAFHAVGHAALWQSCRKNRLRVLADVHTHPRGVLQSPTDQQNPMVPVVGHTALIVPNFARTPWWSLRTVGIYEYLGDWNWRTHSPAGKNACIALTLW
jgi:hypothetical protein